MMRDLRDRRVLITGASSGIGRCLAQQLADCGARLVLAARSGDKLSELERDLKSQGHVAISVASDVTNESDRRRLVDAVREHLGGLDVLVNNAGIASWAHFANSDEEILRKIMEVNFFAPAELIRLFVPILTEGQQAAVVNVGSMCGRRAMPAWPEYSASKYALCGLTEALRGELSRFEIDVLLVLPGLVSSDFSEHMLRREGRYEIDFARGLPPERVAAHIVRAIKKNVTETIIGRDARWMLRFNRFFPRLLDRLLARRVRKLYESNQVV
jgi:short-subunit dehydrogenase